MSDYARSGLGTYTSSGPIHEEDGFALTHMFDKAIFGFLVVWMCDECGREREQGHADACKKARRPS